MGRIVFRVDSGNHIGDGHVSRCQTLALAFKDRGSEVHFVTKNHRGAIIQRLQEHFPVHVIEGGFTGNEEYVRSDLESWIGDKSADIRKTENVCKQLNPCLLVFDHYSIDSSYERHFTSFPTLAIDDRMSVAHSTDFFLDHNISALEELYKALMLKQHCRMLLGTNYSLLKSEFASLHNEVRVLSQIKKILVFFGRHDITRQVRNFFSALEDHLNKSFEFTVILASTHPDFLYVQGLAKKGLKVKVVDFVPNMPKLMWESDLYVGSGGVTSWERACVGLPGYYICIADNQRKICEALHQKGYPKYLGLAAEVTKELWLEEYETTFQDLEFWRSCRENFLKIVDGKGAFRVADTILSLL